MCLRHTRKRLSVNQKRYERACKRTAGVNATFCKKGGTSVTCSDVKVPNGLDALAPQALSQKGGSDVSRRKRVYKRAGEPSVPFCER